MYLAGVKVPLISCVINSQYASLASAAISLHYSPYIPHIFEFTKVQIYEQVIDNGVKYNPTLEFDGVVVGITKTKNVLGQVTCQLTCLTDGIIWNRVRRYDFYLPQITDVETRGHADSVVIRADGEITNFYGEVLQNNKFDVGCAACSILTSTLNYSSNKHTPDSYSYYYNGRKFKKLNENAEINDNAIFTPSYYRRFLNTYRLSYKTYGVSTSTKVQEFFKADRFLKLLDNEANDLYGENSFWDVGKKIMDYGYYNVYDIPNPCFIPKTAQTSNTNLTLDKDITTSTIGSTKNVVLSASQKKISPLGNRQYDGLGEYVFKPISVLGILFNCNIIWPDQVISDSVFYDFINTPTRTLVKKHGLPGKQNETQTVLTSTVFAGPIFNYDDGQYLASYVQSHGKYESGDLRSEAKLSEYENQYGVKYNYLELSYAFDSALLGGESEPDSVQRDQVNNFLNYEFSQRYFGSRKYNVQVTPDVNIVPGLSVTILERHGQHVVAFCVGVSKSWQISGDVSSKNVSINVAYPRYYYENIGQLGNVIDPTSQDQSSLEELKLIIGSKTLTDVNTSSSSDVTNVVESLFIEYQDDASLNKEKVKQKYGRATFENQYDTIPSYVCDLDSYLRYMGMATNYKTGLPGVYPQDLFESTSEENSLSTHKFRVFDNGGVLELENISNRDIINLHLEWISKARRI